ncbi:histidine phosphotransferase ChpT [Rhodovulum bhavnagarense]|uniref:Histidine phosphotransferase ChpT n=1 Tax=Rhodovulum bhavnagarense TaxID=992286 RepID=A0A4R2RER3_9RHOB|nr:histidine phosphotransferase family protein [Rhodovulum bhavnagarense]TCP60527.1 histidine phosphotransferase ChpT [Rhodovulum bhavnagarense]
MNDVTALVGSRICHDLVNPLGAIGNGMELLSMCHSALANSQETALIAESLSSATARLRMMRLAFGTATGGADIARDEIEGGLAGLYLAGRVSVRTAMPVSVSRPIAKALILAVMCAETALPRGGRLDVTVGQGQVRIAGDGPRIAMPSELWDPLTRTAVPEIALRPAEVQFALLPVAVTEAGCGLKLSRHDDGFAVEFYTLRAGSFHPPRPDI